MCRVESSEVLTPVCQATSLLLPMDPPGPPARGLSYSASTLPGPNLSYSASTLPGPNQRQLLLVESAPSSLPLGLVQPAPLSTTSLTTLPSSLIQNKKRRLLTFLSEQVNGLLKNCVLSKMKKKKLDGGRTRC